MITLAEALKELKEAEERIAAADKRTLEVQEMFAQSVKENELLEQKILGLKESYEISVNEIKDLSQDVKVHESAEQGRKKEVSSLKAYLSDKDELIRDSQLERDLMERLFWKLVNSDRHQ